MIRTVLSATAVVLAAAACTTLPPPPLAARPSMGSCDTAPISWVIGKAASPEVVERAQHESHSRDVRVIEPDHAVTMDYREDRLNLYVNKAGAIHKATCG